MAQGPLYTGESLLGGAGIGSMPGMYSVGQQGISAGFDRLQQAMQEITRLLHDSNERRRDRKAQADQQKKQQKGGLFGGKGGGGAAIGIGTGIIGGALTGGLLAPALTAPTAAASAAGAGSAGAAGSTLSGALAAAGISPEVAAASGMGVAAAGTAAAAAPAISAGMGAMLGGALGGLSGLSSSVGVDPGIPTPMQTFGAMGAANRANARVGTSNPMDTPFSPGMTLGSMAPSNYTVPDEMRNLPATPRNAQFLDLYKPAAGKTAAPTVPGLPERLGAATSPEDMMGTVYQYYMENPNAPIGSGLSAWEGIRQFPGYESTPFPFKYDESTGGWPRAKGALERQVNPDYWKWLEEQKKRRQQAGPPGAF